MLVGAWKSCSRRRAVGPDCRSDLDTKLIDFYGLASRRRNGSGNDAEGAGTGSLVAVDHRVAWETAARELGQRAGIFKKHGLTLDPTYPRAESEIETAVLSGSAVVGVDVGIIEVLRAYATKAAPIRIIGAIIQLLVCGGVFADQDGH